MIAAAAVVVVVAGASACTSVAVDTVVAAARGNVGDAVRFLAEAEHSARAVEARSAVVGRSG